MPCGLSVKTAIFIAGIICAASAHATVDGVQRDAHGRIARSESAKNAFKKEHPCPANGHTAGACPGYVIDHVVPLCAGGVDAPTNMQWQEYHESLIKDKSERGQCKNIHINKPSNASGPE